MDKDAVLDDATGSVRASEHGAFDESSWNSIKLARKNFIERGIIPEPSKVLSPEIIDSWVRCKVMSVDPNSTMLAQSLSDEDHEYIISIYSSMIEAARPLLATIDEMDFANDYIFELMSRNGVTLVRTGNMNLHSIIAKNSIMNESTMGTNAHTLCMKYAMPIRVLGYEHYCSALHNLAALAMPVFDENGTVIASFLLTQPLPPEPWSREYQKLLSHAQALLQYISLALEHEISLQDTRMRIADIDEKLMIATGLSHKTRHVLEATVGSFDEAVMVIDSAGQVQYASPEAIHILHATELNVVGMDVGELFGLTWPESFLPLVEQRGSEVDATVNGHALGIRGIAVRDDNNELDGIVVHIFQQKDTRQKRSSKYGEDATITFNDILGTSKEIREVKNKARRYAHTSENILIIGESGTGKELFAQAIHNESRTKGPFMAVNCAAVPAQLIESELFGYESGAFTGADRAGKPGKIELANEGTLFLDEIGDMPLELQATLLRVIENKRVMRIGGKAYKQVDFRLVAATNRDLTKMVQEGLFREDLLYRLSILTIALPPLRHRDGDVLFFAYYFLNECRRMSPDGPTRFTKEAEAFVSEYPWPGNVRQLRNAIYSAFYTALDGEIDVSDFPQYIFDNRKNFKTSLNVPAKLEGSDTFEEAGEPRGASTMQHDNAITGSETISIPTNLLSLDSVEESAIKLAMVYASGNVAEAAKILKISKATLYRKIKEYGLR